LNDKILFLGMLDKEQLVKYYKKASALLMPLQWQEPFGLSMAEANACGTPIIAFRRGSVPEVIEDGKNGFIVDNSAEMIMAVKKIPDIKRSACRNHVMKNFTEDQNGICYHDSGLDWATKHVTDRNQRHDYYAQSPARLSAG
jgi:glycosyltransferase involved in cell wall biosynthesis